MLRRLVMSAFMVLVGAAASGGAFAQATPVQLTAGESRTIEFEGNPSTGYAWVFEGAPEASHRVVAVDVRGYVPRRVRADERPRLGAPAPFQVLLTGVAPGRATLTFSYVKPGTATVASSRSFAVEVLGQAAAQPPDVDAAQEDAAEDPTADKPAVSTDDLFADPNDTEDGGGAPE